MFVFACGNAICGVEKAGDGIEETAAAWVQRHEVKRGDSEDDAGIAWRTVSWAVFAEAHGNDGIALEELTDQIRDEEEDVLIRLIIVVGHCCLRSFGMSILLRRAIQVAVAVCPMSLSFLYCVASHLVCLLEDQIRLLRTTRVLLIQTS